MKQIMQLSEYRCGSGFGSRCYADNNLGFNGKYCTQLNFVIQKEGDSDKNLGQMWHLIQVDYQTKKLHIVALILKYKKCFSNNKLLCILLIIKYCEIVVWNSMRFDMKYKDSCPQVDR